MVARRGPPAPGPRPRGDPRGARRADRLLRPAGRAGRRAGSGHVRGRRSVVVRLCHRKPVAGGPGRGPGCRVGHAVRARRSGRPGRRPGRAWPRSGWLCLGWPDERPPSPGLERRGWSVRLPLDAAGRARPLAGRRSRGPAPPPSRLAPPAPAAVVAAHDRRRSASSPRLGRSASSTGPSTRSWPSGPRPAGGMPGHRRRRPSGHRPRRLRLPAEVTRHVAEAAVAGTSVGAVAARVGRPRRDRGRRRRGRDRRSPAPSWSGRVDPRGDW